MKQFFSKHKVMIIGLLTAVLLSINELMSAGETSVKVLAFAGFIALFSYLSKNLRGQWATIAGILGTGLVTYLTMESEGSISWPQLIGQMLVAYLAATAPPAKVEGYEETRTIVSAKSEGRLITKSK